MSMLSGQDGKVIADAVEVANITRWKFDTKSNTVAYASSATSGFRQRLPGVRHGSGTILFVLNAASPVQDQLAEGDEVTLRLYVDADSFYSVPAVIETLSLDVDVDSGDPVDGQFKFATAGAWTSPSFGG